ncbi:MAG: ABC transporter substrate-binding protein, partial [Verrucomicrobia bacterium]|nr:ABC transporter substrate-binding protein [Verrucomicrobiota bacterium]
IEMNVYDCLVYADRKTGKIVGWLAETWELTDPTTWRMNLRKGVKFHSGDPFTADDAKFSIDRIITGTNEKFIVFGQWSFVKEVRKIDDHTIDIVTPFPEPAFLSKLGGTGCGVVSKKYVEANGDDFLANNGMGTGPFMVKDYDRESFAILEANDNYWGGRPEIDELVWKVIPEAATRLAELLSGGIDISSGVLPTDWARVESNPDLTIKHFLTNRTYQLTVAHTPPEGVDGVATSIPEIRAAISYAINRDELMELVGGYGKATATRMIPPIPCSDKVTPSLYGVNPYDPAKAKELMKKAGYPNVPGGPQVTLHGSFGQYLGMKEIAETIGSMLEEVGFEVKLDIREPTSFREQVYPNKNEELMLESLGNFITDPWIYILNYDSSFGERPIARTRLSDPEIDTLADKAKKEMDPTKRCEYVSEMAQMVYERNSAIVLFHMPDALAIRKTLDWEPSPDGNMLLLNLRFKK